MPKEGKGKKGKKENKKEKRHHSPDVLLNCSPRPCPGADGLQCSHSERRALWDGHTLCLRCSPCTKGRRCTHCKTWTTGQWAAKDAAAPPLVVIPASSESSPTTDSLSANQSAYSPPVLSPVSPSGSPGAALQVAVCTTEETQATSPAVSTWAPADHWGQNCRPTNSYWGYGAPTYQWPQQQQWPAYTEQQQWPQQQAAPGQHAATAYHALPAGQSGGITGYQTVRPPPPPPDSSTAVSAVITGVIQHPARPLPPPPAGTVVGRRSRSPVRRTPPRSLSPPGRIPRRDGSSDSRHTQRRDGSSGRRIPRRSRSTDRRSRRRSDTADRRTPRRSASQRRTSSTERRDTRRSDTQLQHSPTLARQGPSPRRAHSTVRRTPSLHGSREGLIQSRDSSSRQHSPSTVGRTSPARRSHTPARHSNSLQRRHSPAKERCDRSQQQIDPWATSHHTLARRSSTPRHWRDDTRERHYDSSGNRGRQHQPSYTARTLDRADPEDSGHRVNQWLRQESTRSRGRAQEYRREYDSWDRHRDREREARDRYHHPQESRDWHHDRYRRDYSPRLAESGDRRDKHRQSRTRSRSPVQRRDQPCAPKLDGPAQPLPEQGRQQDRCSTSPLHPSSLGSEKGTGYASPTVELRQDSDSAEDFDFAARLQTLPQFFPDQTPEPRPPPGLPKTSMEKICGQGLPPCDPLPLRVTSLLWSCATLAAAQETATKVVSPAKGKPALPVGQLIKPSKSRTYTITSAEKAEATTIAKGATLPLNREVMDLLPPGTASDIPGGSLSGTQVRALEVQLRSTLTVASYADLFVAAGAASLAAAELQFKEKMEQLAQGRMELLEASAKIARDYPTANLPTMPELPNPDGVPFQACEMARGYFTSAAKSVRHITMGIQEQLANVILIRRDALLKQLKARAQHFSQADMDLLRVSGMAPALLGQGSLLSAPETSEIVTRIQTDRKAEKPLKDVGLMVARVLQKTTTGRGQQVQPKRSPGQFSQHKGQGKSSPQKPQRLFPGQPRGNGAKQQEKGSPRSGSGKGPLRSPQQTRGGARTSPNQKRFPPKRQYKQPRQ